MSRRWVITVLGKDRSGIVAGVTGVLYRSGCNLEDSAMTRLGGEFAIMLIFSAPVKVTETGLRRAYAPLTRRLSLAVHVKPLTASETKTPRRRGRSIIVSVYGADRPGIVYRMSEALARAGVNITDVETHRSRNRSARSLYLLMLVGEVPSKVRQATLERRLKQLAKRLHVQVSVRPGEADVL